MPARTVTAEADGKLLAEFGERLRLARLRRRLTAQSVADAAGITRVTLSRAEQGDAAVTIGTYTNVLAALGMSADLALLARDDKAGRTLQDQRLARRRVRETAALPAVIRLKDYPQLQQLAWNLSESAQLAPAEAFQLYERNWRHVDQAAMTPREKTLVGKLTKTIGKGVMLV